MATDDKKIYIPDLKFSGAKDPDGNYRFKPHDISGLLDTLYLLIRKLQGGITLSDLTNATVESLTATTVITQNLYATYGDIVELTVDRLITADKVDRYANSDTSDINYIKIQDNSIRLITGKVDFSGETPQAEQHTDRDGNLLYWSDVGMTAMGTAVTSYPVIVYSYTEATKLQISFDDVGGTYIPRITLGAGDGVTTNSGKAVIYKPNTELQITYYQSNTGDAIQVSINDDKEVRVSGNTGAGFSARNIGFGSAAPASDYQDYDLFVVE